VGHADLTTLLLALATLLVAARICGELARRLGQAEVLGEILAGVLLGPTILGRFAPAVQQTIFPAPGTAAATTLAGIEQLAVGLFLFVAGMEVSLAAVRREGGRAMAVSCGGLLVPFGLGLAVAMAAPQAVGAVDGGGWPFALFFGVAMSVSALPVIARTLIDLGIYRSGIGAVVIPSAIIMDLIGWLAFAVVLSLVDRHASGPGSVAQTVMLTLGFCAVMLTAGRWLIDRVLPWVQAYLSWPGGVLGCAFALALGCAAFTEWIGLHAIFGAFVAGVALGDSPHLRPRTRVVLEDFVRAFFAPLFFAGIGLKVDLIGNFAPVAVGTVLAVACAGKLVGCGLGALLSGLAWRPALAVAVALNARGAMEIVLASIALRFGIIGQTTFVALVFTALATSLIAGPAIKRLLGLKTARGLETWLPARAFVRRLQATDMAAAVRELVAASGAPDQEAAVQAVLARESTGGTGVGRGLAIPHARIHGLPAPLLALGVSEAGIATEAAEGDPARIIVLLLTPGDAEDEHLGLLASIARELGDPAVQRQVMKARTHTELIALLRAGTVAE
jgi:Kef-type K+ transport system membrane component KefB/mannitol/fructose-specific phosphotransferase system IIA component (Ntr-type)